MFHKRIYEMFVSIFPCVSNDQLIYFPNGKNSIRIRGVKSLNFNTQDVVFTTNAKQTEWKLESLDHYIHHTLQKNK